MTAFPVIDTIRNLTDADIALMRSLGITGVSRYIARTSTIGKIMRRDECDRILASGLALMVNYEQSAGDWQGGYPRGSADGGWARSYVRGTLGLSDSTVIIQSIDTGVATSELPVAVAYQQGFNDGGGCGPQGVYGPRNVLEHLKGLGLVKVCWEWMGVAGAASSPVSNIRQFRDKPYPQLPFTYDANQPITTYYGQVGTGQQEDTDLTDAQDKILNAILQKVLALEEKVNSLPATVWDGYPIFGTQYAASVFLHDGRVDAGKAAAGVEGLTLNPPDLAVIQQAVHNELAKLGLSLAS